jgi:hypothetical protein
MADDPHQFLFEPPVRKWDGRKATDDGEGDTALALEYSINAAIREAEAKMRAHPERCNVGYASVKGSFRR